MACFYFVCFCSSGWVLHSSPSVVETCFSIWRGISMFFRIFFVVSYDLELDIDPFFLLSSHTVCWRILASAGFSVCKILCYQYVVLMTRSYGNKVTGNHQKSLDSKASPTNNRTQWHFIPLTELGWKVSNIKLKYDSDDCLLPDDTDDYGDDYTSF